MEAVRMQAATLVFLLKPSSSGSHENALLAQPPAGPRPFMIKYIFQKQFADGQNDGDACRYAALWQTIDAMPTLDARVQFVTALRAAEAAFDALAPRVAAARKPSFADKACQVGVSRVATVQHHATSMRLHRFCDVRIAPIPIEYEPARLGAFIRSTSWAKKLADVSKLKYDPVATTWSYDPRFHGGITELLNAALGAEGEQTMHDFAHIVHASTQAPEPATPMRHVDDDISVFHEYLVLRHDRLEETASSRAPSSIADDHFAHKATAPTPPPPRPVTKWKKQRPRFR